MTLIILTSFLALAFVPGGQASPTGIRVRDAANNCIANCRANFGWPGHPFPDDPWGLVVDPKIVITTIEAGGGSAGTPSPVGVGGVEAAPSSDSSSAVISSSLVTPTLTSSSSSSTPTSTSSSSSSSFTTVHTSTSKPPSFQLSLPPTSSASPPPPPPTSSAAPPPPPPATHSASPSPSPSSAPSSDSDQGSGSTSGATSASDIQAYLAGHNDVRAQHGAAPLTYSQDLAAKAQQWANGCVFQHSGGTLGPFGENLAAGTGDGYGIPQALKSWTDEVSQFNAGDPQPSHFTQVVWKATTQVGCALQNCDGIFPSSFGKAHYYVCEYSPQGNVIGDFGANVQA